MGPYWTRRHSLQNPKLATEQEGVIVKRIQEELKTARKKSGKLFDDYFIHKGKPIPKKKNVDGKAILAYELIDQ